MRLRSLLPVLFGLAALPAPPAPAADTAAPVARLIAQLGSQEFADRDRASRELEALGPAVLEPLRQAAGSDDPEVRRRATDLVQRVEARLLSEKMLAPTRVRLTYRDVPLRAALEDLERRTGLRLALHDPENKLAERRLTLDTGDVPLWQAFDEFCRKAGLAEAGAAETRPPVAGAGRPGVGMIPAGVQGALPVVIPAPPPPGVPAVQAAQIQIQIQVGGQAAVANVQPHAGPWPAVLALVEGKPSSLPCQLAGAVRVRALSPDTAAAVGPRHDDELPVVLELLPEPKLAWRGVLAVRLDRAIDDQGQELARASSALDVGPRVRPQVPIAFAPTTVGIHRPYTSLPALSEQVTVRLRKGEESSKRLREFSGTILAQVQTEPESLMTVDKVLQSSGRTVKGDRGGLLRVVKAERADDGLFTLRVQVENPPDVTPAALRGTGTATPADGAPFAAPPLGDLTPYARGANGLNLLDDKGKLLPMTPVQVQVQANGGSLVCEYTLLWKTQPDRGEPDRLVFAGTRTVTIGIPFSLKDVPLP